MVSLLQVTNFLNILYISHASTCMHHLHACVHACGRGVCVCIEADRRTLIGAAAGDRSFCFVCDVNHLA